MCILFHSIPPSFFSLPCHFRIQIIVSIMKNNSFLDQGTHVASNEYGQRRYHIDHSHWTDTRDISTRDRTSVRREVCNELRCKIIEDSLPTTDPGLYVFVHLYLSPRLFKEGCNELDTVREVILYG